MIQSPFNRSSARYRATAETTISPARTQPGETRRRLDRRIEQAEPPRQVLLDRKLLLQLRLQLELGGVVALLAFAGRDEWPERAALVPVDPVDRVVAAVEAERGREELRAEPARDELRPDQVHGRDEVLEV